MGSNHLSEWGATLDGPIFTLCLQRKRLVAKTPLWGLSHLDRDSPCAKPRVNHFHANTFGGGVRFNKSGG